MSTEDDTKNNSNNTNTNENLKHKWYFGVIMIVWVVLGILSYGYSFMCTGTNYTGSESKKIAMFILALILGPMWWLIVPFVKGPGYCDVRKN